MYVKQKPRRLSGALTWELGPISGELWTLYKTVSILASTKWARDKVGRRGTNSEMQINKRKLKWSISSI